MASVYYDVWLFCFDRDDKRTLSVSPRLCTMDSVRQMYHTGKAEQPGTCNSTSLARVTSVTPEYDGFKWYALFGSSILENLLLKLAIFSWVLHAYAYLKPFVLQN